MRNKDERRLRVVGTELGANERAFYPKAILTGKRLFGLEVPANSACLDVFGVRLEGSVQRRLDGWKF